jgi:hypothetical protein
MVSCFSKTRGLMPCRFPPTGTAFSFLKLPASLMFTRVSSSFGSMLLALEAAAKTELCMAAKPPICGRILGRCSPQYESRRHEQATEALAVVIGLE